jgi:hypothetical protein
VVIQNLGRVRKARAYIRYLHLHPVNAVLMTGGKNVGTNLQDYSVTTQHTLTTTLHCLDSDSIFKMKLYNGHNAILVIIKTTKTFWGVYVLYLNISSM